MSEKQSSSRTRREFLKNTGQVAAASALVSVATPRVHAGEDNTIQVALIGCGGRGSGAVVNALRAKQGPIKLVAMADVFDHRLQLSLKSLKSNEEFGDQKPEEGFMWDDEDCPLSSAFVKDMATVHSVADKAAEVRVPYLLVHGKEDDLVPIGEARAIFEKANEPRKLVELDGVDHVFNGDGKQQMVNAVVSWMTGQLG